MTIEIKFSYGYDEFSGNEDNENLLRILHADNAINALVEIKDYLRGRLKHEDVTSIGSFDLLEQITERVHEIIMINHLDLDRLWT